MRENEMLTKALKQKHIVIWKCDQEIITWKPKRTPKLAWNELTLLEALTDSAKTFLAFENYQQTANQLNSILTILRKKIEKEKANHKLLHTCQFRETKRTRCNCYPTKYNEHFNLFLCEKHFKALEEKRTFKQEKLEVEG